MTARSSASSTPQPLTQPQAPPQFHGPVPLLQGLRQRCKWRVLLVTVVVWGSLLRFYNLGAKVYWEDEVFTSLRLAGHTRQELVDATFQGAIVYPQDLLEFQNIKNNRDIGDTVASLTDDTHPPAYFVLLRLWARCFGSSTVATRSLSAIISLLLLPSVYGLAWTLFERSPQRIEISLIATALAAVSPYQIALANEARMYSLLPVVTTLAGTCMVKAIQQPRQWTRYGLLGSAGLYVHWLAVPILFGHGLHLALQNKLGRSLKTIRSCQHYGLAIFYMVGAILPWIIFVGHLIKRVYYQTQWTADALPLLGPDSLSHLWFQHSLLLFFHSNLLAAWPLLQVLLGILTIAGMAKVFTVVVRRTPLAVGSFLLINSSILFVPMAIADLTLGGRRSSILRYFGPSLSTWEIAIAFCLVTLGGIAFTQPRQARSNPLHSAAQRWQRWLARGLVVGLLMGGVLSQTVEKATYSAAQHPLGQVAQVLNKESHVLLVSDSPRPTLILPLAHLLQPQTAMQLTVRPELPNVNLNKIQKTSDRSVYLYLASEKLQTNLKDKGQQLTPIPGVQHLWKVDRQGEAMAIADSPTTATSRH